MKINNKGLSIVAHVISIIAHPLLVYLYVFIALLLPYFDKISTQHSANQLGIYLLLYILVSIFLVLLFFKFGLIKSVTLSYRQDRFLGYLCFIVPLLALIHFVPKNIFIINFLLLHLLWSFLPISFINLFWKMSAHLYFWGTIIVFFMLLLIKYNIGHFLVIGFLLAISGIVAWARLYLNAHSPNQVYVGFIFGIIQPFLLFSILL